MRIYGLKSCDSCRAARKALPEAVFVDLRETPLDQATLARFHGRFGDALVNRRSTTWRGLGEAERTMDPVDLIAAYPTVMKRPVIERPDGLWLGWTASVRADLGL